MMQLASSLAYLFIPLYGPKGTDLTQFPVDLALITDAGAEPSGGDWHAATWISPDGVKPKEAALLIGPGGGTVYPSGEYMAYARLTAGAEKPVLPAGRVRIGAGQ
jgi:hypothetical protein